MHVMSILLILLSLFTSGCGRHKAPAQVLSLPVINTNDIPVSIPTVELVSYMLEINDVECDLCAHAVETAIGSLEGVTEVMYRDKQGDYDGGQLYITAQVSVDISIDRINKLLEGQGFSVRKFTCLSKTNNR